MNRDSVPAMERMRAPSRQSQPWNSMMGVQETAPQQQQPVMQPPKVAAQQPVMQPPKVAYQQPVAQPPKVVAQQPVMPPPPAPQPIRVVQPAPMPMPTPMPAPAPAPAPMPMPMPVPVPVTMPAPQPMPQVRPWSDTTTLRLEDSASFKMVYPKVYYRTMPYIMMACDEMEMNGTLMPTDDQLSDASGRIFSDLVRLYPEMAEMSQADLDQSVPASRGGYDYRDYGYRDGWYGYGGRGGGHLGDLISILLLSELFRRRRRY